MNRTIAAFTSLALVLATGVSLADNKPPVDSGTIIEALKPVPREPRTRNLMIRPNAPAEAGPAANVSVESTPVAAGEPKPQISLAIPFDFNSAKLSPGGAKALDQLGKALTSEQLAGLKFSVEGHTDAKGSPTYNQKLSQARADEVRRYLIAAHGVEAVRLAASGKASSELANPGDPLAAENRRVRIVTLNQNN